LVEYLDDACPGQPGEERHIDHAERERRQNDAAQEGHDTVADARVASDRQEIEPEMKTRM
jgi:hypothetical protein